jgi:hypothetical protein
MVANSVISMAIGLLSWQHIGSCRVSKAAKHQLSRRSACVSRPGGFLRLWTANEAVLKQRGAGFHRDIDMLSDLKRAKRVFDLALDAGWIAVLALASAMPDDTGSLVIG